MRDGREMISARVGPLPIMSQRFGLDLKLFRNVVYYLVLGGLLLLRDKAEIAKRAELKGKPEPVGRSAKITNLSQVSTAEREVSNQVGLCDLIGEGGSMLAFGFGQKANRHGGGGGIDQSDPKAVGHLLGYGVELCATTQRS